MTDKALPLIAPYHHFRNNSNQQRLNKNFYPSKNNTNFFKTKKGLCEEEKKNN